MSSRNGPQTPYVSTVEELHEIVSAVQAAGAFSFDVETRGNIHRHSDVMDLIEDEWQQKLATLKSAHPTTLARSRQAIEDRWTSALALDTLRNEVFWIGIAVSGRSWAIPMGHPNGEVLVEEVRWKNETAPEGHRAILKSGKESLAKCSGFIPATFSDAPHQLTHGQVFSVLQDIFMDPAIAKVNQNIKFDAKSVAKYLGGSLPAGQYIDTQVLMHIVDENLLNYRLSTIIDRVFSDEWASASAGNPHREVFDPYFRHGKLGSTIMWEPFSKACNYVHYDCRWAWLLYQRLWRLIAKDERLFNALRIDLDCLSAVARMEMNGILVNRREMVKLGQELERTLNSLMVDILQYTKHDFNPNADTDVVELLFNTKRQGGLGLKPTKLTKTTKRPSVDAEALGHQKGKHPVVDMLLDYSETKKLQSTYIEGMVPLLHRVGNAKTFGRVHPQFHFHRTATGRLSSSDPNLQNIPRDGRMRALFVAPPGESLLVADYSQIEMRIMAMFSQDPALLNIFANDIDVHTGTATVILGRAPADSEERNIYGKVPNFLMGYGGGAKRLVAATNGKITLDTAQSIVDGYNTGYAGLTSWKNRVLTEARRRGYVETLGGRRRRLPDLNADRNTKEGWTARSRAERQAINAIVQGTAAEVCKKAMTRLDRDLDWPNCKLLVQVHDEMVISVPTDELGIWRPVVEEAMGNNTVLTDGIVAQGVKLVVEAHAAGSWYDAKGG